MAAPGPIAFLLALVLPDPERRRFALATSLDVPFWSFLIGLVEFIFGAVYMVHDALSTIARITAETMALAAQDPNFGNTFEERLALNWSGALNVLLWLAMPFTWFLISIPLVGMMRLVSFATAREASGELLVWAPLRIAQLLRGQQQTVAKRQRFGPPRPDRFVTEPGADLVLLTARPQEEWNEAVTIEIDGRFYKMVSVEERRPPGERWDVYAYKLNEEPENALIRRLVGYRPPVSPSVPG